MKRYFTLVLKEDTNQWLSTMSNGQADAEQTLNKMRNWLKFHSTPSQYDHAVLFTGRDLATDNEGHTTGRGTKGTMCRTQSYDSVSVIEDRGAFQSVFTMAHEMAHSLNAGHDGTSNACSASDNYIMTPQRGTLGGINRRHPWIFSACTGKKIAAFVGSLNLTETQTCLARKLAQDSDVPDVTGVVPGQLYGRDTQCQHLYGPRSVFCFSGNLSAICTWMPCSDPSKPYSSSCNVQLAATGTSCGNKKWCQVGECVESASAPALQSCVGDQNTIGNGQTCKQMAANQPELCYDLEVFNTCCYSCQNIYSGVEGCPYGNRKRGCRPEVCQKILFNGTIIDEDCCSTCRFDRNSWTCGDVSSIDGMTCAQAVQHGGLQGCYNFTLAFHCCATCQRLRNLDRGQGCEYGDRLLQGCLASSTCNSKECSLKLCCHTCGNKAPDTSSAQRYLPHLYLLVLLPVFVVLTTLPRA
ncbi:hypothetical protein ACOMHN_011974 [Nucella lapillus]